jgi:hypothetical protein
MPKLFHLLALWRLADGRSVALLNGVQVHLLNFCRLVFVEVFMPLPVMPYKAVRITLALFCAVACSGAAAAQGEKGEKGPQVAGEYVCTEARVAGKAVPCRAAPLNLKNDGKFELQGREGEYLVNGSWVELNGSILSSRAKLEAGHKIVFRFYNKKGLCEMIYERRVAELGKTNLG